MKPSRFELLHSAILFVLVWGLVPGCGPGASECPENDPLCAPGLVAHEGDLPGECIDGADNDRDGAYDCDDSDCAASPDCDTGNDDDTGDDDDSLDGPLNLVESVDPELVWDCTEGNFDGRSHCWADYVALGQETLDPTVDLDTCREEWAVRFQAIQDLEIIPDPVGPLSSKGLGTAIEEALGLGDWWTGLDPRLTEVTEVLSKDYPWGVQRTLLLNDPFLRMNEVWEMRPAEPAAVPFIVVLPGHPDGDYAADEMTQQRHLIDYVEAGYGVLVLDTKAYDSASAEHLAVSTLLCAGKSLMVVRAYEALLLHKYVRYLQREGRAESRIALLGNSGGSVVANMLTRFFLGFDAVIADFHGRHLELGTCEEAGPSGICMLDECHEGLYLLHEQINNKESPPIVVPTLNQPYGYTEGPEEVLDFLDAHLLE